MQLLMCPPSYYGIEYEINPWMQRNRQSDAALAARQWSDLHELLRQQLSAEIHLLDAVTGLPDMVFTANAGVVWQKTFIVSNFRHAVRRGEARHYAAWFRARGFEVVQLPDELYFEGEGDLLRCGASWFAGYHFRSDMLALQKVADVMNQEVLSLELTSEWFYHLDTCFCPLTERAALFYPPAFDVYACAVLQDRIPDLITVPDDEARRFACNAVVGNGKVVMNSGCPVVRRQIERLGLQVFESPLDEFLKAGGSAKCLTLIIG
jgi:N-dimethylarginine dimethylaminohydrolase